MSILTLFVLLERSALSKKSFLADFNPISGLANTLFMKAHELGLKDVNSGRMAIHLILF